MASKNISLEPPSVAFTGEARYLTPLWVFGTGCELPKSATTEGFEVRAGNIDKHDQTIHDKIKAALKLLALRKPHVLVQFWSPRVVGTHQELATTDQPFGLGVSDDQRLISYRRDSECKIYDEEEDIISPLVRVFRQGLPEWSLDITNYLPKDFPQQECAIRCNLHGYLALPVFDPTTTLCVGVLELLMSSMTNSFYYGSCFCVDVTKLSQDDYPLVHHASKWGLSSCFAIYFHSVETNVGYVLEFFLPSRLEDSRCMLNLVQMMKHKIIEIASGFELDDINSPIQVIGPHIIQTSSLTNNYLKQGTKRKRGSDKKNALVTVTYGEDIKRFRFPISLGLLKLKYKVAKKFKLKVKMIRLKYIDEENDVITICVDKDLNDALVASGNKHYELNL
ncbi:NIN-like protein [Artemisia annua]|uniref:NIN-like protein n=1 Tax=Artemisia annua TaxID=35608 RepID=A0A2U1PN83_ARTAN|nr:NIN-like protein [Artemisia annua]